MIYSQKTDKGKKKDTSKYSSIMKNSDKVNEIIHTLEEIDKANKMLAFHKQFDEPDLNAIENFKRLRQDFLKQLALLLKDFEIEIKMPIAA